MDLEDVVLIECKHCHGGENGEKVDCLEDIVTTVESGKIAFMLFSHHVEEIIKILGYRIIYRYADNDNLKEHALGMWIRK